MDIKFGEPMAKHTTFKIGGPAEYFLEAQNTDDLKMLLKQANRYNIALSVIGSGSNILICDEGVGGIVLRLGGPCFSSMTFGATHLYAGSSVILSALINSAKNQGLTGLEFLSGIPATLGGALVMNAGISECGVRSAECGENKKLGTLTRYAVHGTKNIGDLVVSVKVMDHNGHIQTLSKDTLKFSYRKSNLSKYIVLGATLKLRKADKREISNRIEAYLNLRKQKLDLSRPSAGCIFKNPKRQSAGRLIDLCGLKGKTVGNAYVSRKHANFIVNKGRARASDVLALMEIIKKRVKNKFNVSLKPEIRIWK